MGNSFRQVENSKVVLSNTVELFCSMEDCNASVVVHKKDHAKLAPCTRDDCPNKRS